MAVAEQEGFELVHENEGNKPLGTKDVLFHIIKKSSLNAHRAIGRPERRGFRATGPGTTFCPRQTVIIDHGGRNAVFVFVQVINHIFADAWPRTDASPETGVAEDSRCYRVVAERQ